MFCVWSSYMFDMLQFYGGSGLGARPWLPSFLKDPPNLRTMAGSAPDASLCDFLVRRQHQ